MSVVPFLVIKDFGPFLRYTAASEPVLELSIANNGAGVARINSIAFSAQSTVATGLVEILRVVGLTRDKPFLWWGYETPYYLRPGEGIPLFKADANILLELSPLERAKALQDIADRLRKMSIVIRYESIYGEAAEASWPSAPGPRRALEGSSR